MCEHERLRPSTHTGRGTVDAEEAPVDWSEYSELWEVPNEEYKNDGKVVYDAISGVNSHSGI